MEMVPHGFYGWWLEKNPWLPISDVTNIKIEVFRDHKEWEGIPAKDAHSKLLIHTHPSLCRRDGGFQSYRQVEHFFYLCLSKISLEFVRQYNHHYYQYYYCHYLCHHTNFSSFFTFRSLFPIFTTFQNSHTLPFFRFSTSLLSVHLVAVPAYV